MNPASSSFARNGAALAMAESRGTSYSSSAAEKILQHMAMHAPFLAGMSDADAYAPVIVS